MKTNKEWDVTLISLVIASMLVSLIAIGMACAREVNGTPAPDDSIADTNSIDTMEENDTMLHRSMDMAMAFATVESGRNPNAVNDDCVGFLQISPILVREVNRLLKQDLMDELDSLGVEYDAKHLDCEEFTLADREDMYASIAMFCIIMDHKNPTYDLRKACRLWNPTAGNWYYKRVKKALNNEEE